MNWEPAVTRAFNKAAENRFFRGLVRHSGALVWGFYTAADTMLIAGPRHYGEHVTRSQDVAGGLFLAVDQMFLLLDKYPKIRGPMSAVYLGAATAFGIAGWDHDGRWLQLAAAAIIAGKALGHLKQSFRKAAEPEDKKKEGLLARYPVISTVAVDLIGKTLFAIGAIVGNRPDLIWASRLDLGGTISSLATDKSLKKIVEEKEEQLRAVAIPAPPAA